MAKKIKKFSSDPTPRRSGEKLRRATRQFDRMIVMYILTVIISVFIGSQGEFSLSQPGYNGFAISFLLLPAYLPLLIIGGIFSCFGIACGNNLCGVYLLGGCDLALAILAWLIMRIAAKRKQSTGILKTAKVFVLIMVVWGIFQIGCSMIQLFRTAGTSVEKIVLPCHSK